jgi:glycosyltransferase involved in cell wall biosynthesis
VVFQHDRIPHFFPAYLGRRGIRKALADRTEGFLRRCRWIVTHSEHGRRDLAQIPGVLAERIQVIRPWLPDEFNPQEAARLAPVVRSKYRLPERFWLYVGGFDYRKNVELLIAAYARVAGPEAPRLVLAGRLPPSSGPYCDVQGALARAGLREDAIVCPGFIASEDMPGLFGAAELMIYPSRYEGFGLPPMEAMGCGCPAVCADNSSLPEVVRDAEYRFTDNDEAALRAVLARARAERLPFNPSFTRADFSEKLALDAYVTLFNSLAAA